MGIFHHTGERSRAITNNRVLLDDEMAFVVPVQVEADGSDQQPSDEDKFEAFVDLMGESIRTLGPVEIAELNVDLGPLPPPNHGALVKQATRVYEGLLAIMPVFGR